MSYLNETPFAIRWLSKIDASETLRQNHSDYKASFHVLLYLEIGLSFTSSPIMVDLLPNPRQLIGHIICMSNIIKTLL